MLVSSLEQLHVPGLRGRPRTRPDRVMADKRYPSKANRAWLRERGIAATIPERDDQIAHRRKKRGRPIDFGDEQCMRYRGRNVVERCFNKLKQWRGIAVHADKTARNYHAGGSADHRGARSRVALDHGIHSEDVLGKFAKLPRRKQVAFRSVE